MKLYGLQKLTLLDYPGHVACTVFLSGCDYRCPFCHNYELADGSAPPLMEDEEFFSFLRKRGGLLDAVAVSGGEPLMRPELPAFLRSVRALGFSVKLDTNGAHPDALRAILEEGLADYVAMDIKNAPEKYAVTCGVRHADLDAVSRSIRLLMEGPAEYEFRTTCVDELHEPEDFAAIGQWIRGAKNYCIQCFTDRDTVPYGNLHAPSREKMEACLDRVRPYVPGAFLRGI